MNDAHGQTDRAGLPLADARDCARMYRHPEPSGKAIRVLFNKISASLHSMTV
jgi:hypothetical protein